MAVRLPQLTTMCLLGHGLEIQVNKRGRHHWHLFICETQVTHSPQNPSWPIQ